MCERPHGLSLLPIAGRRFGWQQSFILKSNSFAMANFIEGSSAYTFITN